MVPVRSLTCGAAVDYNRLDTPVDEERVEEGPLNRLECRRCVMLFSRGSREEATAKGLTAGGAALFDLSRRRVTAAVASLPGIDLFRPRQRGSGFRERLLNAFRDARALGYREIVAVPADAPGLGRSQIAAAFAALGSRDVVLGRSPDGGVYLLGVGWRADLDRLVAGVRWRTRHVTADLISISPSAAQLEAVLADIDRRADLATCVGREGVDPELDALVLALTFEPVLQREVSSWRAASRPGVFILGDRSPPGVVSTR